VIKLNQFLSYWKNQRRWICHFSFDLFIITTKNISCNNRTNYPFLLSDRLRNRLQIITIIRLFFVICVVLFTIVSDQLTYKQSTTCLCVSLNLSFLFFLIHTAQDIKAKLQRIVLWCREIANRWAGIIICPGKKEEKKEREEKKRREHTPTDADINGKRTVLFSFYFYRVRARRLTKMCVCWEWVKDVEEEKRSSIS
jgi:hypothetical protein